ncbi:MAG: hypothetical protein RI958_3021 [Actinomycetota bacterium]
MTTPRPRPPAPTVIGAIVFLQGMGVAIPLGPLDWQIRSVVLPAIIAVAWFVLPSARPAAETKIDLSVLAVAMWLSLSALWTTAPSVDVVKLLLFVLVASFCTHFGTAAFDTSSLLDSLAVMMAVTLAAVAVYALARPGQSFSGNDADAAFGGSTGMRSFFAHKNGLGMLLAFGIALVPAVRPVPARALYTTTVVVLLLLANSSTAIIAAACVAIGQVLVSRAAAERRRGPRGAVFLVVSAGIVLSGSVVAGREFLLELFGKDPTLTGRSAIWSASIDGARARPLTGYGLDGFWQAGNEAAYRVQRVAEFDVTSSHQGVIDLWLTGGAVAVALYVVLLGGLVVMLARRILVGDGGPTTLVAFGLVAVITVVSLSESNLTAPGLPVLALTSGLLLNVPATTRAAPDRPLHVSTRGIEPT